MEVQVGDRTWRVTLQPEAGGHRTAVESLGAGDAADAPEPAAYVDQCAGGTGWSVLVSATPGSPARSHDVVIESRSPGEYVVHVDGQQVPVRLPHLLPREAARGAGRGRRPAQRVVAGIPGRVVRVLVRPGDVVQPRQPVVVLEAMKMQNELRATEAGSVLAVHAVEGGLVDAGTVLVEIGPALPQP